MRDCSMLIQMTGALPGLLSVTAGASTFDPPLNIEAADACVSPVPSIGTFCANGGPPVQHSALVSIGGTYSPLPGVSLTASASGQSGFGLLKAGASASFNITGSPETAWAEGAAAFRDVLTVNSAALNGTPGLMFVSYNLDGIISSMGNGGAALNVETFGDPTDSQQMFQNYTASVSSKFASPAPLHFVYGQPFNLGLELWTEAGTLDASSNNPANWPVATTGTGSATADFTNTLLLSGLIPTDLNGKEALDAQFTSASGTVYTTNGVIPEPATVTLFFCGLCIGALAVWKKKPNSRLSGTAAL